MSTRYDTISGQKVVVVILATHSPTELTRLDWLNVPNPISLLSTIYCLLSTVCCLLSCLLSTVYCTSSTFSLVLAVGGQSFYYDNHILVLMRASTECSNI